METYPLSCPIHSMWKCGNVKRWISDHATISCNNIIALTILADILADVLAYTTRTILVDIPDFILMMTNYCSRRRIDTILAEYPVDYIDIIEIHRLDLLPIISVKCFLPSQHGYLKWIQSSDIRARASSGHLKHPYHATAVQWPCITRSTSSLGSFQPPPTFVSCRCEIQQIVLLCYCVRQQGKLSSQTSVFELPMLEGEGQQQHRHAN